MGPDPCEPSTERLLTFPVGCGAHGYVQAGRRVPATALRDERRVLHGLLGCNEITTFIIGVQQKCLEGKTDLKLIKLIELAISFQTTNFSRLPVISPNIAIVFGGHDTPSPALRCRRTCAGGSGTWIQRGGTSTTS